MVAVEHRLLFVEAFGEAWECLFTEVMDLDQMISSFPLHRLKNFLRHFFESPLEYIYEVWLH